MKELAQQARSLFGYPIKLPAAQRARAVRAGVIALERAYQPDRHPRARTNPHQAFPGFADLPVVMRESPPARIVDVGSGAGFPGLPLKIIYPAMQLTLVESVGKKADFCRHVIQKLGLEGVQVVQERAETLGRMPEHRQQYDWALARAVAVMNVLVEYLLPLARVGGAVLAMKGENAPAESARRRACHPAAGRAFAQADPGHTTGCGGRPLPGGDR